SRTRIFTSVRRFRSRALAVPECLTGCRKTSGQCIARSHLRGRKTTFRLLFPYFRLPDTITHSPRRASMKVLALIESADHVCFRYRLNALAPDLAQEGLF